MKRTLHTTCAIAIAALLIPAAVPSIGAQTAAGVATRDTVVVASESYSAGGMRRMFLGANYRDLWAMPIRVPILDLERFAGGIKATKTGGNKQTKSLRFEAKNGTEYSFRPVFKAVLVLPDVYRNTIVWSIFEDQFSAPHPTAPVIAVPFLKAAGILHAPPTLYVMPDDSTLGEFRKEFAGVLGTLEESPGTPDDAPGFAGAVEIIDSDELRERLNKDPRHHVNTRALLAARLLDLLMGDADRHQGQWRWARLSADTSSQTWEPIPRDRDKVVISYEGFLLRAARLVKPQLVRFDANYADPKALFANAIEFDQRLLGGLDRTVWDSVALSLTHTITNSVIDEAMAAMPAEYASVVPGLTAKLRARRDKLPEAARMYYRSLFTVADVHGTDAAERATITRSADDIVDVEIRAGSQPPHFRRRFERQHTREVRVYLHGGNDTAVVRGTVNRSIPVRVIGGNGDNRLRDSSSVNGKRSAAALDDEGQVDSWNYKADTVGGTIYQPDTAWNRRPWRREFDKPAPPRRDHGARLTPIVGLKTGAGLGFTPKVGVARTQLGYGNTPYLSRIQLEGSYSFGVGGYKVDVQTDHRGRGSRVYLLTHALASQLEMVDFHGFGNDVPEYDDEFYDVRQTQWMFHPAVGFALGPNSDISFGPVVKYVTTDTTRDQFIAQDVPYGAGSFGQAGVQLNLRYDTRDNRANPQRGISAVVSGSAYPALWDARERFEEISGVVSTYFGVPLRKGSVLALRGGGKKLFGDFPYYEAAFVGGSNTVRTYRHRQFAGDASLYGSVELRVPLARFAFFLPLDLGMLGFYDTGRVFVDGESGGGWHDAAGAGLWLGILNSNLALNVSLTNRKENRVFVGLGFNY